ncbi:MAG: hypothetical protein QNJ88_17930 [Acidimicrobiia bacterium]|nr:hypothetical protein [Acidimicrobiia bacterium]
MRTLLGFLVFTLLLAAGCTANEPAPSGDTADTPAVVSDAGPAGAAVAGNATAPVARTLLHELSDTAPAMTVEPTPAPVIVETTGEPWLADAGHWAHIAADSDDPRLEAVAERIPDYERMPIAIQVNAERPDRPHEHIHPGNG